MARGGAIGGLALVGGEWPTCSGVENRVCQLLRGFAAAVVIEIVGVGVEIERGGVVGLFGLGGGDVSPLLSIPEDLMLSVSAMRRRCGACI